MKLIMLVPYASASEECGALCLLSRYLCSTQHEVSLLRCNGVFSLCDRDEHTDWQRGIDNCFRCAAEQREVAQWSETRLIDISPYLHPRDITDSKEWLSWCNENTLCTTTFQHPLLTALHTENTSGEILPYQLCKYSFRKRFGVEVPDLKNRLQEQVLRRLMLSAVRMSLASSRFIKESAEKRDSEQENGQASADLYLVAGGNDYISASFCAALERQGLPFARFEWKVHQRSVEISRSIGGPVLDCGIVLDSLNSMRADYKTWPNELLSIVENLVQFLGISPVRGNSDSEQQALVDESDQRQISLTLKESA